MPKTMFSRETNNSFGFILSNVKKGERRYYYPSQNGFIFNQPLLVAEENDLLRVLQRVGKVDCLGYVRQQKLNSKERIALLTNVAFHVYPLVDRPIGRGTKGMVSFVPVNSIHILRIERRIAF